VGVTAVLGITDGLRCANFLSTLKFFFHAVCSHAFRFVLLASALARFSVVVSSCPSSSFSIVMSSSAPAPEAAASGVPEAPPLAPPIDPPAAPPLAASSSMASGVAPRPAAASHSIHPVGFAGPVEPCEGFPPAKPVKGAAAATVSTLKLLTWNVWFDAFHIIARMAAIGSVIEREQPHFVALQEVTHKTFALVRRESWAQSYYISAPPANGSWYFTLIMSKYPFASLHRRAYESNTKRDLLWAHIDVPVPVPAAAAAAGSKGKATTKKASKRVVIATSHLESSAPHRRLRLGQMELALGYLGHDGGDEQSQNQGSPLRTVAFVGDMNLHNGEGDTTLARHAEWRDSWLEAYAKHEAAEAEAPNAALRAREAHQAGTTYDGKTNGMVAMNDPSGWSARLDRIYVRLEGAKPSPSAQGQEAAQAQEAPAAAASTPEDVHGKAVPASAVSVPAAAAVAAEAEWRIAAVERVGLCALDVQAPQDYARTKPYKSADGGAAAAAPGAEAQSKTVAGSAEKPVVFPSDHYGLLLTLQLNENTVAAGDAGAAAGAAKRKSCCIC